MVDQDANRVSLGDKVVRLTRLETDIVKVLHEHSPRFLTGEYIEACVLGLHEEPRTHFPQAHICNIRRKLSDMPLTINNEYGNKYQLVVNA